MIFTRKQQSSTFAKIVFRWLALSLLLTSVHAFAQTTGTVTYVYTDPQGTPLAEADANGNITATFNYTPYGTYASTGTSNPGPDPNGPGYTGHVNDPETNLIYMQARYYDPATGHFLSVDPISPAEGDAFNFNRYAYASNNPTRYIDPEGMAACAAGQSGDGATCPPPPPPTPSTPSPPVKTLATIAVTASRTTPIIETLGAAGTTILPIVVAVGSIVMDGNGFHDFVHGGQVGCYGARDCGGIVHTSAPSDAKDPNGAKAPGKPGEKEGFKDPKTGEKWVKNPNGRGSGWLDADGNVWVPTGWGGSAHGGPHWDVQDPEGGNDNVYPGGRRR